MAISYKKFINYNTVILNYQLKYIQNKNLD